MPSADEVFECKPSLGMYTQLEASMAPTPVIEPQLLVQYHTIPSSLLKDGSGEGDGECGDVAYQDSLSIGLCSRVKIIEQQDTH